MPGFPVRPSLDTFGAEKSAGAANIKPEKTILPTEWNLVRWQTAGLGVVAPLAVAYVQGSDGARLGSGEAWNPRGDSLLQPEFARTSTGIYTITYAASYPDAGGVSVPLTLLYASVSVVSTSAALIGNWSIAGQVVTVRIKSDAGTLTDANFTVEVR